MSNWAIRPYQVLIVDIHMPMKSGFEAVDQVLSSFKEAVKDCSDQKKKQLEPKILIISGDKNGTLKQSIEKSTSF